MKITPDTGLTALIPRHDGDGVVTAPGLTKIAPVGFTPLAVYRASASAQPITVGHIGCRVGLLQPDGSFAEAGSLPAQPWCALAVPGGITVMCAAGPWRLALDGTSPTLEPMTGSLPGVAMRLEAAGAIETGVPAITLSAAPDRDGALAQRDINRITEAVMAAYARLRRIAARRGLTPGPCMAAWRLIAHDGTVMQRGSARAVTTTTVAAPSIAAVTLTDGGTVLPQLTLRLPLYKVRAYLPPQTRTPGAKLELCAVSRWEAVDGEAPVTVRIQQAGGSYSATIVLPGRTDPMADLIQEGCYTLPCTRTVTLPHSGSEELDVPCVAPPTALRREPLTEMPWGFAARQVASSGDTALWGDILALPPSSFGGLDLVADRGVGSWQCLARLVLADGSVLDSLTAAANGCPVALSPVIAVPESRAVRLDVWVRHGMTGAVHHASLPLEPLPDGCGAAYVGQSPVTLADVGDSIPEAQPGTPDHRPGTLLAAPLECALMPVCSCVCAPDEVTAVVPAPRTASAWSVACGHFYAFSPSGSHSVAVTAGASRSLRASAIDSRGATARPLVGYGPDGVCVGGPDGLRVYSGTRGAPLLAPCQLTGITAVAWDAVQRLWWVAHDGGKALTLVSPAGSVYGITPPGTPAVPLTVGRRLTLAAPDGLYEPGEPQPAAVRWQTSVRADTVPRRGSLLLGCTGSGLMLRLRAECLGDAADPGVTAPVIDAALTGRLRSAIRLPWRMPPGRDLVRITLSGNVSSDFILTGLSWIPDPK